MNNQECIDQIRKCLESHGLLEPADDGLAPAVERVLRVHAENVALEAKWDLAQRYAELARSDAASARRELNEAKDREQNLRFNLLRILLPIMSGAARDDPAKPTDFQLAIQAYPEVSWKLLETELELKAAFVLENKGKGVIFKNDAGWWLAYGRRADESVRPGGIFDPPDIFEPSGHKKDER